MSHIRIQRAVGLWINSLTQIETHKDNRLSWELRGWRERTCHTNDKWRYLHMPALCMLLWAESLCFRLHVTRDSLDSSSDEEPSWIRLVVLRCEKFVGGLTWKQGSKKILSPPSFSLSNSWQYAVNGEDDDLHLEVIHCPAKAAKTSHPLLFS